jgi:hypothetical protein
MLAQSQVARDTGWSFATVWRRAANAGIELTAGRVAKGYKRLPAEQWSKIAETITKNPKATQQEVARAIGREPLNRGSDPAQRAAWCLQAVRQA